MNVEHFVLITKRFRLINMALIGVLNYIFALQLQIRNEYVYKKKLPKLLCSTYIDDVFAIFDNNCNEFLKVLNRQHNIKFTVEKTTNSFYFLDLELEITNLGFNSWIWRKPTNTGLLFHYTAKCPQK